MGTYTATTTLPDGRTPDAAHGMLLNLGTVNGTAIITVNGTPGGSQATLRLVRYRAVTSRTVDKTVRVGDEPERPMIPRCSHDTDARI